MRGQAFTIAKLNYINGVVYFVAQEGSTDIKSLAKNSATTTKSGKAKHPEVRVRSLIRFAEGLGLLFRQGEARVEITKLGKKYYEARGDDYRWSLSRMQKKILREHILSDITRTPTIHAIASLLTLIRKGYRGKKLERQYAIAIAKEGDWRSDATYEGYTKFGLNYLFELDFIEKDGYELRFKNTQKITDTPMQARKTFLFTWNPNKFEWNDLPQAVCEANAEGRYLYRWSCGNTRNIVPGDRAFLMRLGSNPKGIMGSGIVVSELYEDLHWDPERNKRGEKVHRVEILFDVLSDLPILSFETLSSGALGNHNWLPQSSGTQIPNEIVDQLERLWSKTTQIVFSPPGIEEIPRLRNEGSKRCRWVTSWERNPEARRECIRHHGTDCKVCGLSFEKLYGQIGKDFIHVHHVIPISTIQEAYEVDPLEDLCPVCPNCHAILHKRTPPYTISELKAIMTAQQSFKD